MTLVVFLLKGNEDNNIDNCTNYITRYISKPNHIIDKKPRDDNTTIVKYEYIHNSFEESAPYWQTLKGKYTNDCRRL